MGITLAMRPGVPPRLSNELLARKAANTNIQTGLAEWLAQLRLTHFASNIQKWCKSTDTTTTDEIVAKANDLANALRKEDQNLDENRLAAVRQILAHAAPGKIQEKGVAPFKAPLKLRGKIHARLRGE